jgi:thymidine kinase
MRLDFNPNIKPGFLEVFCGPMNCGKSRELVNIVDRFSYMQNFSYLLIKPKIDVRSNGIKTRFGNLEIECSAVDEKNPAEILSLLKPEHEFVGIEEAQFFSKEIAPIINSLLKKKIYVVVTGLDLDFRGEPFGPMPDILSMADEVHKLTAICSYEGCNLSATRTQRLINGEPAHYNSPLILIGDTKEGYCARCLNHHIVPGKH